MQMSVPNTGSPCLIVLENNRVRSFQLSTRAKWLIGRSASGTNPDISLSAGFASRNHGSLIQEGGRWHYCESSQTTNGTYHNGSRVTPSVKVPLHSGDILRIQSSRPGNEPVIMVYTSTAANSSWRSYPLAQGRTLIGRNEACNITIPLPFISGKHAQVENSGGQYFLSDCGSRSGTYLNGRPVNGSAQLRSGDSIFLCGKILFFLGNSLMAEDFGGNSGHHASFNVSTGNQHASGVIQGSYQGNHPIVLKADIQTKKVKNNSGSGMKELIRDIHLEIREGTLVALLGTAGAGKSTVMNCLNGMDLEGVQGRVMYRNVDLMRNFDQVKHRIGSVPQKKTFHPSFTPEQEFTYAAQKRLPGSVSNQEIQKRVNNTLQMLSMNGVRNVPNSKLSGGEQTRVNVGIELVADRDLLCLDEPDQGLSPNYKHELFQIMRDLAHKSGKSVLSIIHDVSEIDMFDQVIMLAKVDGVGRLAFSGSPAEAKQYFGVDIQYAYSLLEQNPKKFVR